MTGEIDRLKNQVIDLNTGIIQSATGDMNKEGRQSITFNDSTSISAKVLVPNFGSDREYAQEGRVDVRRFTNISPIDVIWLAYFLNIPTKYGGDYAKRFSEQYMNLRYSVGGEHKKITVNLQEAIGGGTKKEEKKKLSLRERITGKRKDELINDR